MDNLQKHYMNNKQYANRYHTDVQRIDMLQNRSFHGIMDRQARFIEEKQLLDEEYWMLFIKQFTFPADDVDEGWRGEYFGKMMRGACMTYQYTKNERLYQLLAAAAEKMLETQDPLGRFSTYSVSCEFNGWDMWCRKYVMLGLLHFHEICNDQALRDRIQTALTKHLDYIVDRVGSNGKMPISATSEWWGAVNSSSILEPTLRMYNLTGKESYLEFARCILDYLTNSSVDIASLALEDKLQPHRYPVTKAYEIMSCFEGLLEYYRITGEEKWKTAVVNFVEQVHSNEISLIGCAGCDHELFNHAVAKQTDTDYVGVMQETCVTVTWMKLCNQLLLLTGDAKYADWIEQSAYNALYGAVNNNQCTTGEGFLFDSYSPLTLGTRGRGIGGYKNLSQTKHYGCCAAIGAAGTALPILSAVTSTREGIKFNFYEQGSVRIGEYAFSVETRYPADGNIRIILLEAPRGQTQIALRIPAFAGASTCVRINGESVQLEQSAEESRYLSVSRSWEVGDEILLWLDMNPRILRATGLKYKVETQNYFAVLYGPLVMARDAQISQVGTVVPLPEKVEVLPRNASDISCILRGKVILDNEVLEMIDYSSAGKTWDTRSLMEAWIKCE